MSLWVVNELIYIIISWTYKAHKAKSKSWKTWQKAAQRDNAGMQELLEISCLWWHLEDDLVSYIGKGSEYDKIVGMWEQGCLVKKYGGNFRLSYQNRFFNK